MFASKAQISAKTATLFALVLASCSTDHPIGTPAVNENIKFENYSVNPSLVKTLPGFENLQITTLISSDDKLAGSPDFIFGAQPDGAALMKDPSGDGYVLINNHEIHRAVSRVYLDKTLKPTKGEYIVDGDGGIWRLCSATLATQQEHGFGPVFLTAGESGAESMVHAINPIGVADKKNKNRVLPALGKASMENAVPLPKEAFPGKTVVIIGEDDSDGQLLAYVSNTVGDLENGKLYFLRTKNGDPVETNLAVGQTYDVEFVEVDNAKTSTGAQIAQQSKDKKAIQFARVEDVDYRKGGNGRGREIYFTATGVSQADKKTPVTGKTMWGRIYKLVLDASNPLTGKLTPVIDGGIDPGNSIVNPDNICVTDDFVYIQEDGDSFYLDTRHDGRIWQWGISNAQIKPMIEMNHRRDDAAFNAKYNSVKSNNLSSWEYGAMYDISDIIGVPNTFAVNIHPHTWQDDKYLNSDGSGVSGNKEGGQVVIVRGVQK
ncbi:alkaline phosphatase PhoX [Tellurirhabdus rosea]|uniref:alkaline phosphatase PhoX n=1 Tax=Tellurirhabdus rosea TaxID=2674997 RepID=UPI0022556AE7|nr:alkaline phosphatase PhoX [Tellurirhabdus rosea]